MIFKKRDPDSLWDKKTYRKARSRATKLERFQILSWIDTTGTHMAQMVYQYRRHQTTEHLKELKDSVTTLAALIDEVEGRNW